MVDEAEVVRPLIAASPWLDYFVPSFLRGEEAFAVSSLLSPTNLRKPMDKLKTLTEVITSNDSLAWLSAIAIFLAVMLALMLLKRVVLKRVAAFAARTSSKLDDGLIDMIQATRLWLMLFPALLLGSQSLELPPKLATMLQVAATIALFLQVGIWGSKLVRWGIHHSKAAHAIEGSGSANASLGALNFVGQALLWSIILLMTFDNLGIDVTAMVAGLGVGGIAVALAVQNILGDLFASLSIIIDKPFVVGDFIIVGGEFMGTVEHIGIKTTRVRSLGGEQIIFSNNDLLQSRVRNYKRMYERRVVFGFRVLYQTTAEQLERIPEIVKKIIEGLDKVRFDRAHFFKFGDSSLDFEVVYWVLDSDYNVYMDLQQTINLKLVRALEEEGTVFAYPTRTVQVEGPVQLRRVAQA
jgi:small-conductance mechanosensitive channel